MKDFLSFIPLLALGFVACAPTPDKGGDVGDVSLEVAEVDAGGGAIEPDSDTAEIEDAVMPEADSEELGRPYPDPGAWPGNRGPQPPKGRILYCGFAPRRFGRSAKDCEIRF